MKFNTGLRRLSILALWTVASAALAQTVYRNVDQNGKVSFSDTPPAANAVPAAPRTSSSTAGNANLPYELRQVVQRYPVTLYTSDECGPCGAARSLLVTRGVPFDERTVKTNEDIEALQRLSGQNTLPLVSIGSQQLKGFSDAEWSQYLDAAGYPKSAQLPASYRNPPAQPLVAAQPAVATAPPVRTAPTPAPAAPATVPSGQVTPSNPAGIKF
jgi:glutaredoxin